jgi:hypothetical protein
MYDIHQTFSIAYYGASGLLVLAAAMVFFVKPPDVPAAERVKKPGIIMSEEGEAK